MLSPFERLVAVATSPGTVMEKARQLIGEDQLAILIAKAALSGTSVELSATKVSRVLEMPLRTAYDRIDSAAVSEIAKSRAIAA